MSCDCCCKKILRLCKASVCGSIDFGITAQVDGVHKMEFDFLGSTFSRFKQFAVDDKIIFPLDGMNESYTFIVKLYEPDGKQVVIKIDDIEYDCFEFETALSYAMNEIPESSI